MKVSKLIHDLHEQVEKLEEENVDLNLMFHILKMIWIDRLLI